MFQVCIWDNLLERNLYTPFVKTESEARDMARSKIARMESSYKCKSCNRFEIKSIVIQSA